MLTALANDAQHIAAELDGRFNLERAPVAAIALTQEAEYTTSNTWMARRELFAHIGGYYNRVRIQSAIGYITPQ